MREKWCDDTLSHHIISLSSLVIFLRISATILPKFAYLLIFLKINLKPIAQINFIFCNIHPNDFDHSSKRKKKVVNFPHVEIELWRTITIHKLLTKRKCIWEREVGDKGMSMLGAECKMLVSLCEIWLWLSRGFHVRNFQETSVLV